MITLGINAAFHDSAAALVIDGHPIAAAEEERFTRIKHAKRPLPFSAWELPFNAIDYCLREAGIRLVDVDHVAYSYDPRRFLRERATGDSIALPLVPSPGQVGVRAEAGDSPWDPLFAAYMVNVPGQLADGAPHHLQRRFDGARFDGPARFHHVDHHLCHQASAFLASPFERCAVMTLDGRGEQATTSYGLYRGDSYQPMGEVLMPHSLGLLYERVTAHLGFLHSSDEYKVMALAALGRPVHAAALRAAVHVLPNGQYRIDASRLPALLGAPRQRGGPMDQSHYDIAASLQCVLEETALQLAAWLREAAGERRLVMAGGVALNCLMNSKLRDSGIFDEVWVQPAAGDAGTALGAALWIDARERAPRPGPPQGAASTASPLAPRTWQMLHPYLGPADEDEAVEALLRWAKLDYRRVGDPAEAAAKLLAEGCVIGWHQGRMEFGPRALGSRSILASPIDPAMQARINELKDREDFRPVAPAVPEERLGDWFSPAEHARSRFMLFVYDTLPEQARRIPSACHADLSARVQTVSRDTHPTFHALLERFGEITGVPVLINTSFNVRGEPIVCTAKDAIDAFHSTPLDALVIGPFVLEKPRRQGVLP